MGFVLGGLDSEDYDRTYSDIELIKRIGRYFRQRARLMLVAGVSIMVRSLIEAGVPLAISAGLDIVAGDPELIPLLLLTGGILLLEGIGWLLNYVRQRYSARAIGDVVLMLRADVMHAVVHHDLSFFDDQPSGKLVSRITSDTQDFGETVNLTMNLISQVLSVGVIAVVALSINVQLTLLMLAMTPVVFVIALSFRHIARKVTRNARRMLAQVNANIQESVSGIAVAKSFRQEDTMYREFDELNRQAYRVNMVRGLTLNTIFPLLSGAFGMVLGVMIYFAGSRASEGVITVGQWYLFMQAMGYFWFPMTSIASFWSQFQDGLASAERVFSLIDAESQVKQTDNQDVPRLRGEVAFRKVCLTYTGNEVVLPEFSLEIAPGETVALVGHTGTGKTSVARLLTRLYEFQGGEILVDGYDIRTLNLAQYRRQLGFVPQSPFLFTGTVCDNIRYGCPEATQEAVEKAARQVTGGQWVDDLTQGLSTDVGERGSLLSMGQRQLVALARVLLTDPAIFVLDEATASVDPFTERQIQEGLDTVMRDRTSIVIAHRLSTVRNADRIIVMREGEIIEQGSHDELLEQGGHYAELYETYFRHQSIDYVQDSRNLTE